MLVLKEERTGSRKKQDLQRMQFRYLVMFRSQYQYSNLSKVPCTRKSEKQWSVELIGNSAGLFKHGTGTIISSTFAHNFSAGGIRNSGPLTISQSLIYSNSTISYGGGISSGGLLKLIQTTIENNTSLSNGGGLYNGGAATIIDSTISGNQANCGLLA